MCAHLLLSPEMVWAIHTAFRHQAGGLVRTVAGSGSMQGEDSQVSPRTPLPTGILFGIKLLPRLGNQAGMLLTLQMMMFNLICLLNQEGTRVIRIQKLISHKGTRRQRYYPGILIILTGYMAMHLKMQ